MANTGIPAHLLSEIAAWAAENDTTIDQAIAALITKGLGRRTIWEVFPDATTDADLVDYVLGDGDAGESVEYITADGQDGDIDYRRTWGHWILTQSTKTDTGWEREYIVCRGQAEAEQLYRGAIEELHREGVEFAPDSCPIFDELAAAWK